MATGVTTVDCHKQVRSWRLLRSLIRLLIPTCNRAANLIKDDQEDYAISEQKSFQSSNKLFNSLITTSTTITGTIFGYRRGKISFCIQENANSANPILLLELAVPTSTLAKEMRGGSLRITLESNGTDDDHHHGRCNYQNALLSNPLWTMYCNGRKVGYAVKRRPSKTDFEALRSMRSVAVGTGVNQLEDDELMYLRASFQRVRGSSDCESFHLIHPEGENIDQELSIFFFRSS